MNAPSLLQRHPALRWLTPLAVVGVAGLAATGIFRAQASSDALADTSANALIAAVRAPADTSGFSGTVVSKLSLGLPGLTQLPQLEGDDDADSAMTALLDGSHTLQVWYGGPARQRIALLGANDETDVFRSGRDVWEWSSADRVARHMVLSPGVAVAELPSLAAALTPTALAARVLEDLEPSTTLTVRNDIMIANRRAYELVLTPRDGDTLVGSVHIAIDGATKLPLGVRVYARGADTPALDIAYSSIRFARPSATYFTFTPPLGAMVDSVPMRDDHGTAQIIGTGWSSVRCSRAPAFLPAAMADAMTRVKGDWGSGRVLSSDVISVLVTRSGRMCSGAVRPAALYAAVGDR